MEIVRTTMFAKSLKRLNASEAEIAALETAIAENPDAGDVIPGLGGVRKIRFALGGRGKRGGGRCIYLALRIESVAYLLLAYGKSQQTDLSERQRKAILALIEEIVA